MRVAMISEVFFGEDAGVRLGALLHEARQRGADIALLPELPLNDWCPYLQEPRDEDAEELGGPREIAMCDAAASAGISVVGGVIRQTKRGRFNTALVIDATGDVTHEYAKVHLPEEAGFWETSHYQRGDSHAEVVDGFEMPFGVQICSDINRPQGSQILAASGAQAVFNPRANSLSEYERWKHVFIANALTCCCYVLSVNRPRPEHGVALGGPSVCVAPDGEVLAEGTETLICVDLDTARVEHARTQYPGYLDVRSDVYAREWSRVAERDEQEPNRG